MESSVRDSDAQPQAAGILLILAAAVLWSLAGVAVKAAQMPGPQSVAFAFYRSLMAALAMSLLIPLSRGHRPPLRWMLVSALLYTTVVTSLIAAMTFATAAAGILLQYTAPVFCALFAWFFQRRRIEGRTLLAIIIASIGIVIMILSTPRDRGLVGPVCGIISGIAFGALFLVLEKLNRLADGKADPFYIVLFNNAGAAVLLLPICAVAGILAIQPWQLGLISATAVVQLATPYVLFQLGLRRVSPVDASLLTLLEPVLNPLWVALIIREIPDLGTIIGGCAILSAMAIEISKPSMRSEPAAS